MIYLDLLLGFLWVGCFSFGGAYGAIPLIRDVVLANNWLSDEQMTYIIAVSESTPGPIMINIATYVGNSQAGFWGAVLATVAVVLPAFIIILLIMLILRNFIKNQYTQAILAGFLPCIVGIILATGAYMVLNNVYNIDKSQGFQDRSFVLTILLLIILFISKKIFNRKISPIKLIILSAVLGWGIFSY